MAQGSAHEHDDGRAGAGAGLELSRNADFLAHRGMVFSIAYDITGMVADAEDIVQETYLRWRTVDGPADKPRAYLARIATRQALNAVRSAARRREDYPGEWLPEPLPTGESGRGPTVDPEAAALTAAEVSTAMLVVLQTLSGPERAAFILHDVFGFGYPEISGRWRPDSRPCASWCTGPGNVSGRECPGHHRTLCSTGPPSAAFWKQP